MSGSVGIVNLERKNLPEIENIQKMAECIKHRGKSSVLIKNSDYTVLGGVSSEKAADEKNCNPMTAKVHGTEYTICFDGLIYNSAKLVFELKAHGIYEENMSDAQIVLFSYIKWGVGCLKKLNGIFSFAIWNQSHKELFLARDRFGIKPLYYTVKGDFLIFASEIKGILMHPLVDAVLDESGICEVMGLGPAHTQGSGIFSGIYELLPAHCATYNKNGFNTYRYWSLESKKNTESFEECLATAKELTFDAINSQLDSKGRDLCFFLSGGLDSSAICALAAERYGGGVNTFSLRYQGNEEYFTPGEYQPASDDYYVDFMSESFGTNHHIITVNTADLINHLSDAVISRDVPGMADVDSSLYFLCNKMGAEFDGALSGECADEVFGGYPWFHRREDFEATVFPWAKNLELRRNLISPTLIKPDVIEDYIRSAYSSSISDVPLCDTDNKEEARRREIAYLNLNWFMYTLGARSERIGMNCGLEIRMPYCDYKLVEYIWNVPWDFKAYKEREKGLLRMVFNDTLPDEILWRKKSPFPKTHNPEYENAVKEAVKQLFADKSSPVLNLVNENYIKSLFDKESDYQKPWFGQLMATPQLYGYIIQLDFWLRKYNIKINL